MARIVLQPDRLPQQPGPQTLLVEPWRWWRHRINPDENGNLYVQSIDEEGLEHSIEFSGHGLMLNPPAMNLTQQYTELLGWGGRLVSTFVDVRKCQCEVVWFEEPGPDWEPMDRMTCCPGLYKIGDADNTSPEELRFDLSRLNWPLTWCISASMELAMPVPNLPALIGAPLSVRRSGAYLNPEGQVLDEIDQLVNEQVLPGPRDDYNLNRYPKCKHCRHDWHGLPCDHCTCLGDLEDG